MTDKDQAARDWPLNDPRGLHKLGPIVACGLCGTATLHTGTKRCDRCWELESRIQGDPELAAKILEDILFARAFKELGYMWSADNVAKARMGWRMARGINPPPARIFKRQK